ncbi:MAG: MerR family transcriptional regulator [Syntrophaceae bacterium]|nr:MerR family transcriptional regulator [Syntrophaceae bacterium]
MNYNTATAAAVTGLTVRQISYWDSSHFIKPSISEAAGYGSARLYSFGDLVQLKVAKTLKDQGISVQKMRKAVSYLKKHMPDIKKPLADLKFLTDGSSIFVLTKNDREVIDTLNQGQAVLTVAVGSIIEELKGQVLTLSKKRAYEVKVGKKKYPVVLHADTEDGGYWVEAADIPGCVSQGDTVEEALGMIKDAIEGCLAVLSGKKKARKAL